MMSLIKYVRFKIVWFTTWPSTPKSIDGSSRLKIYVSVVTSTSSFNPYCSRTSAGSSV